MGKNGKIFDHKTKQKDSKEKHDTTEDTPDESLPEHLRMKPYPSTPLLKETVRENYRYCYKGCSWLCKFN